MCMFSVIGCWLSFGDRDQASKMSRLAQLAPDLIEAIALGRLDVGGFHSVSVT